jgi:hypothetical protein
MSVDFGEEEVVADESKTINEGIRTFFSEMFTAKPAAGTFSEADVKRIATEAVVAATAPLTTKITTLETSLSTQAAQFAERETKIAGSELKQRAADAVTRLKGAGKWIPAFEKMGLSLVFEELAGITKTVEFGEGDAKKTVTPLETLVLFMEGLPKVVPGGTVFAGNTVRTVGSGSGDPLTDAAKARAKEKSITFSEALDQISAEQPELTRPGAGTAGSV